MLDEIDALKARAFRGPLLQTNYGPCAPIPPSVTLEQFEENGRSPASPVMACTFMSVPSQCTIAEFLIMSSENKRRIPHLQPNLCLRDASDIELVRLD